MSDLLTGATSAGLKVIGVSLNMTETGLVAYQKAISLARLIFALGKSLGHDLSLLDLGEMMPMNNQDFEAFEEVIDFGTEIFILMKLSVSCQSLALKTLCSWRFHFDIHI